MEGYVVDELGDDDEGDLCGFVCEQRGRVEGEREEKEGMRTDQSEAAEDRVRQVQGPENGLEEGRHGAGFALRRRSNWSERRRCICSCSRAERREREREKEVTEVQQRSIQVLPRVTRIRQEEKERGREKEREENRQEGRNIYNKEWIPPDFCVHVLVHIYIYIYEYLYSLERPGRLRLEGMH